MPKQCRIINYLEPRLSYQQGKTYCVGTWRKKVIKRDNRRCRHCFDAVKDLFRERQFSHEAHHIIARRHGGKNTISNGITLCKFCHHYFDYVYGRYKLDYHQALKRKSTETRLREVRALLRKRFIRYCMNMMFN